VVPSRRPGRVHETEHDGYSLIVRRNGDKVRLFTRRGHFDPLELEARTCGNAARLVDAPRRGSRSRAYGKTGHRQSAEGWWWQVAGGPCKARPRRSNVDRTGWCLFSRCVIFTRANGCIIPSGGWEVLS
jgi:hypothetical protein